MREPSVILFNINRYAINDGPGIRTTIFMKGCPLRCVWCHNPESWLTEPEVLFNGKKCIGCNSCKERSNPPACPTKALEQCGREWTMEELMAEIEKERDIMSDSGGGVTLCGGEPLRQPAAALAILKELGLRGFHRTVDTSLYAAPETVEAIAKETDLFLVDIKHMDSALHHQLTGVSNERILSNIRLLANLPADDKEDRKREVWFRMPLIKGVNADETNIAATAQFIAGLKDTHIKELKIHLLPYHDIGKDKHRRRGTVYNPDHILMETPTDEEISQCRSCFEHLGIKVVIGG